MIGIKRLVEQLKPHRSKVFFKMLDARYASLGSCQRSGLTVSYGRVLHPPFCLPAWSESKL